MGQAAAVEECKGICEHQPDCTGFVFEVRSPYHCHLRRDIYIWRCEMDRQWDMYTHKRCGDGCVMNPQPPTTVSASVAAQYPPVVRFYAIGDWNFDHDGWDHEGWGQLPGWVANEWVCKRTCQTEIADVCRNPSGSSNRMPAHISSAPRRSPPTQW